MSDHDLPIEPFSRQFCLKSDRSEIEHAQSIILSEIKKRAYDPAGQFGIRLALEEALSNAFKHGNAECSDKTVSLDCQISMEMLFIAIEDQGTGFDPETVPDPTQQENVEIPAGRGLTLMRSFMTTVKILPPGNRVEMTYRKP